VLAAVQTRRQGAPLWKSSALAVLFHNVEVKARVQLMMLDKGSAMDERAKTSALQLRRGGISDGRYDCFFEG
jgi:hypothetical protein